MARAVNNGWDFLEVGKQYQYKEDWLICKVTILEDNSDDEFYSFLVRVDESSVDVTGNDTFTVSHRKDFDGIYNGMSQFYETDEYMVNYSWKRKELKTAQENS